MELNALLGKKIRSLRRNKDLTQGKLAEAADISVKYLGEIERGQANLSIKHLEKLAVTLDVNLSELFDFGHEMGRDELLSKIHSMAQSARDEDLKIIFRVLKSILE